MKSPLLQFLIGSVFGGMIAVTITLHIVTKQVEARTAAISADVGHAAAARTDAERQIYDTAQQVIDAWKRRAEACEGKFNVGTVVYEKQELASIPLLGGLASLKLGASSGMQPSLYIPAQVDIYTERPDVRYQWVNGRTGESQAIQIARSPSEAK
jgi:hypothetical protein